ncbi:MAG: cytochrome C [Gallionellaceae bacterium]|nr:cytochrome C [Gallionellaceae bacterium]
MTQARAESVMTVLSPGKVIQGHAKIESECARCHKKFDKAAQSSLCGDCHKEAGQDMRERRGYHGRIQTSQECKTCHTDHKGRNARIVIFDAEKFDHAQTEFQLKGGHLGEKASCKACHPAEKKYREAPSACISCHQKDDKHKGGLGNDCASCHLDSDWKKTGFDHDKTRYPLTGKHVDVKCAACHLNGQYKNTPTSCSACHQKDDERTHRKRFGQKCETCHTDRNWKEILFNHDKTRYALRGGHRIAKCAACHTGELYKEKLQTACLSCHKKDDERTHKGKFGAKCESCHTEQKWKDIGFDHDKDTKYRLLGKHRDAKCAACHKDTLYKDKVSSDCYACHEKDDKHKGQQDKKCESCHNETAWNKAKFDHATSRFPLTGRHVQTECKRCHASVTFKDAGRTCWACHQKEDTHKRRLGMECETCHNTRDWKVWDFDHDKTRFRLEAGHKDLSCDKCHRLPMNGKVVASGICGDCHASNDPHGGGFGRQCESCHEASSWKRIKVGGRVFR